MGSGLPGPIFAGRKKKILIQCPSAPWYVCIAFSPDSMDWDKRLKVISSISQSFNCILFQSENGISRFPVLLCSESKRWESDCVWSVRDRLQAQWVWRAWRFQALVGGLNFSLTLRLSWGLGPPGCWGVVSVMPEPQTATEVTEGWHNSEVASWFPWQPEMLLLLAP